MKSVFVINIKQCTVNQPTMEAYHEKSGFVVSAPAKHRAAYRKKSVSLRLIILRNPSGSGYTFAS